MVEARERLEGEKLGDSLVAGEVAAKVGTIWAALGLARLGLRGSESGNCDMGATRSSCALRRCWFVCLRGTLGQTRTHYMTVGILMAPAALCPCPWLPCSSSPSGHATLVSSYLCLYFNYHPERSTICSLPPVPAHADRLPHASHSRNGRASSRHPS